MNNRLIDCKVVVVMHGKVTIYPLVTNHYYPQYYIADYLETIIVHIAAY